MALNMCAELFFRVAFELLKYFIENWLSVLILIAIISWIASMLKEMVLILAAIATFLNIGNDILLGSTAVFSLPINILISFIIAIFWVTMVNNSNVNSLFKLINIPLVFLIGFIWSMAPVPVPLAILVGVLLYFRITNYIIGFLPILTTVAFVFFLGPTACSFLNFVISALS